MIYTNKMKKDFEIIDSYSSFGRSKALKNSEMWGRISEYSCIDGSDSEKIYLYRHQTNKPICKCGSGAYLKFISYEKGYSIGCGRSCPVSIAQQTKNRVNSLISGGGVGFARKSIADKASATMQTIYGVSNVSKTECKKENMRNNNPMFLDGVKEKLFETNQLKYGTHCVLLNEEILGKINATNVDLYGVKNPGVLSIADALKIKQRYKYESFSVVYGITPLFGYDEYIGLNNEYEWSCNSCGTAFVQSLSSNRLWPTCEVCSPKVRSKLEDDVYSFFVALCEDTCRNERKIISNELDMFSPSKKFAIEVCGLYWHSEKFGRGENYHYIKTKECSDSGISLMTIFEDEWYDRGDIIRAYISNKLSGGNTRIHARNCSISVIDSLSAREFYEENHIQGFANSTIHIGLILDGVLMAAMSFSKPRAGVGKSTSGDFELVRFATKIGYNIPGGFSKLLSYFSKNNIGKVIYSFSDNRYSSGDVYRINGFEKSHDIKPRYSYLNPKTGKLEHRFKYTKFKLVEMGYDENLTEKEIMESIGFFRVWDCGKICWRYICK